MSRNQIITSLENKFTGEFNTAVQIAINNGREEELIKMLKDQIKTNPYEMSKKLGLELFRAIKKLQS